MSWLRVRAPSPPSRWPRADQRTPGGGIGDVPRNVEKGGAALLALSP